jgi:deoxyadenosine/deoxycytidine kinase
LAEDEYRLYRNLLISSTKKPKPDLYIYLYQNSERLLQNIKKRAEGNKKIPAEYLDKINSGYLLHITNRTERFDN